MPINSNPSSGVDLSRDRVLTGVKEIVAEYTSGPPDEIREHHRLVEDLGYDSLALVEMGMELEEHFDVSVPDEFGEQVRTVGDVIDGVRRLLGESERVAEP